MSRLPVIEKFVRFWRIYRRDTGNGLFIYIFVAFLATLIEGVGIGLVFPLIGSLQPGSPKTGLEVKLERGFSAIGLRYQLPTILLCLVLVFLLKAAVQFFAYVCQNRVITSYQRTITNRIYVAITRQRYQSFLSRSIGTLNNVTVNECYRAGVSLMRYASLFPSMLSMLVFSLLALRVDWQLTFGILGAGTGVLFSLRLLARYLRRLSRENTALFGRLNELSLQAFQSFKYLRATMGMPALERQIATTVDQLSRNQYKLNVAGSSSQLLNEPVAVVLLCGMIWEQTVIAQHPLSQVVVLAVIFYRLIREVMTFQSNWHGFAATMGSIDLVAEVIHDAEKNREVHSGKAYPGIRRELRFDGVSFAYGDRAVLHDCRLVIPRHAMVALVGESGSGKSTLVDLLTGMLPPQAGRLLVDDLRLDEIDLATYRAHLGYVTQEPALFNDTIANNISFWEAGDAAEVRRRVEAAARSAHCADFLSALPLGYDTVLGDRGVNLSGGQRQRVAIARELYKEPDLLILDEATSALDSESELAVQKSIEGLRGRITTVVIAHRLSTIRNADLIYVLSEGRVLEAGNFASLFAREGSYFRKFCQLQGLA